MVRKKIDGDGSGCLLLQITRTACFQKFADFNGQFFFKTTCFFSKKGKRTLIVCYVKNVKMLRL